MALAKYRNVLQDRSGNTISGAVVSVFIHGTATAASLFSDVLGTSPILGNTVLTDANGTFQFYVEQGRYDMTFSLGSASIGDDLDVSIVAPSFSREVSVERYNAKPTASAAYNADAIQDCVSSNPRSLIIVPGRYAIDDEIIVTDPITTLAGNGIDASMLRQTNAAKGGLFFNFPISFGQPTGGGVKGMTVEAGAGFSTGSFYGTGSTGSAIKVRNASDNFEVESVSVHNFTRGYELLHCWNTRWNDLRALFCIGEALLIDQDNGNIGAGNTFESFKFSNNGISGGAGTSVGMRIRATGGEWMWGGDITKFFNGVLVDPASAQQQALYLFFDTILADTCTGDGWVFDGTNRPVWSHRLNNCWGAYNDGAGIVVKGSNSDSVRINGGAWRENALHNIWLRGGVNHAVGGPAEIASAGRGNPGVYHGIQIDANVSRWHVSGVRSGNFASLLNTQQNGINISAGTSSGWSVTNCDLSGNLNFPLSNGSSSLDFVASGNLPRTSQGVNATEAQTLSGASCTAINPGGVETERYLGPGGHFPFARDSCWIVVKPGVVLSIWAAVSTAPGTGETFTYELWKNGASTGLSFVISGSGLVGSATTPAITVTPTDSLELKLVASAGSAASKHRYFISLQ